MTPSPHFKNIKKDYQAKNLRNPFFHQKNRATGKRRPWSLRCLILGIIVLLFIALWFFLAAPFWNIKKVEVLGLTRLSDVELKNIIWNQTQNQRFLFLKQNNLFLFNRSEAVKKILNAYNFSSLTISKKMPGTLELKVSERPLVFIFQQGNDLFYSSPDGYLIKEVAVTAADKAKYWLLENQSTGNLIGSDNKLNLEASYLAFIIELRSRLASYPDLPLEKFVITDDRNTIGAKFVNGPVVRFSTTLPVLDQIKRLILVKKEKIKDNFSKLNYIDLRYGDRIFINPEMP